MTRVVDNADKQQELSSKIVDNYFSHKASENDMWQFFHPVNRRWNFLRVRKITTPFPTYFLILRNGWVVRKIQSGRPPFYFAVLENKIKAIKQQEVSSLAYEKVLGSRELHIAKTADGFGIDLNSIYLPTP